MKRIRRNIIFKLADASKQFQIEREVMHERRFKDKKGNNIHIGDEILFFAGGRWREGVARRVSSRGDFLVDDGDAKNDDLATNNFHIAVWLPGESIEKKMKNTPGEE